MKPMIQKTTRVGFSLFLLAVLVAGALSLSAPQTVYASTTPFAGKCDASSSTTLVCDPNTGLEWLKLTETVGQTYDYVISQLGTGGIYEGYRYASNAEAMQFLADAGINGSTYFDPANLVPANAIFPIIGVTLIYSPYTISAGFTADAAGGGTRSIAILQSDGSGAQRYLSNILSSSTSYGSWLVVDPGTCLPGTYEYGSSCVPADPGYYVALAGATSATPCPVGAFQPLYGAVNCNLATPGHYVDTIGSVSQTACPVGTFQPAYGAVNCDPATPGHYVDTIGAASQTACPVGTFQSSYGAVNCDSATPGHYVDAIGAASQNDCQPGTYQPYSGQTSCLLADPGYYVDTTGAVAQTMCPEGFTSDVYGATECYRINTAPTANAGGPYLVAVNASINFDGSGSTDPENDPLTETWTADGGAVFSSTFTAGSETGIYDVCLTVNDGSLDSDPSCTMTVVYDPSAGFVTGGGWIDSPAGAYTADASLTGKATFGFVSKYKKGASVPTGNTSFEFDVAGFEFHSDSYEWLVVNQGGKNAQFKGSGAVNDGLDPNGNPYKFMLWGGDGSPDTFRIKIWWEDNAGEHVVYDNGFDQAIGGGSIVVHKGK